MALWTEPDDDEFFEDPFDADADTLATLLTGKPPMNRYVVSYDIIDNRRRVKVANCLDSYGQRVQKSVFEVLISRQLHARMVRELTALIDPGQDRISIYPQCGSCDARRVDLGVAPDKPVHQNWIIV
ncbi:CRISPR-associated endonuclease Cas2 [Rhodocista pekingensis]|uniref:CRISPR-associated endoribonuclease Cas2 n=1 Tax=Rhodocista pekingensis TaxID=201185 RepID=A0ABW2KT46_9PROT